MKKNELVQWHQGCHVLKKILNIMKLTTVFFFVLLIQVSANSLAQQTKLNLKFENQSLETIFSEIEANTNYSIFYKNELIEDAELQSGEFENKDVFKILDAVLKDQNLTYTVEGRLIMIKSKNDSPRKTNSLQQNNVKGKVTDSSGEPLPGVSIVIKGTTNGTITDFNGNFELSNLSADATLIFSFVGMKAQEIEVAGQTSINITMEEDAIGLEEVVAIGYGVAKKSDLTGAVTRVDVERLADLPNVSIMQSLKGAVPGLNVSAVDGVGQNPTLSIRGQNTLSSSSGANAPLIVVDGIIYHGSIIDLNTDDIESIDILKDASSAAIYGSQASNGVMIITTKKGTDLGKPIVSYSGSYTIQIPSNELEPMKASEAEEFFKDAFWTESRLGPDFLQTNPDFNIAQNFKTKEITDGYLAGLDTDWWEGLTRNGSINKHNLSIRGKGKSFDYFISGGYTAVEGFMKNDDYKKYSYRANMNTEINNWLRIGFESFLTSSDYSGETASTYNAFLLQPWAPISDENGELVLRPEGSILNPYAYFDIEDSDKRLNIFGNFHADIKLPIKGFNYRVNFSQNYRTRNHDQYDPYAENQLGVGFKRSWINYDWSVDNILTFTKTFNEIHTINATLVYGVENRTGSYTNPEAKDFINGLLGYNRLQAGNPELNAIESEAWKETSLYSMGRVIYNFNNKYLVTGTVRRDGFSGFGTEEKIGVFPSVAVGWVASEEDFLNENVSWLNYLKLRGSYGTTGRRAVDRYQTLARLSSEPSQVFGDGGSTTFGQWISSMANNELGWETTTGLNLGVDFTILNSRLYGNVEYYTNDTKDILYNIQLPTMTGFSSIPTNIGEVHNHGMEFSITGKIVKSREFSWDATLNFARNRNEIVSILGFDNDGDGKEDDLVANRLFIGEPQQVVYDYEINGLWQLSDEQAGTIPSGFFPGQFKIIDLSGPDGVPDDVISAAYDRKILGYRDPSYRFSIANNVSYKNFSLYVLINSIQGGKNYYYGDDSPYSSGQWTFKEQLSYLNGPAGAWDYWTPENPNAKYRRLDAPSGYRPRPYSQRNFIRLQDISLSYTFNKSITSNYDIGRLKVYVSAQNLLTITKWKGWDPETGRGLGPGVPLMKNFTFGLNVEF